MMYKKFQLKNGLTVLLLESSKSPVLSIQMWVKTGSADEAPAVRGISHFIEHLVFKGTDKYGVGEIAQSVEGAGGELNAYTSFDQTVFYVTVSKAHQDTGLSVISQMMGHPTFDADEIDNEREVVIEEIKRGQDNPHRQASRLLFENLFRSHPYGEPVIGYEKIIRKVSRKKILDYYHSRYVPKNMTLVIVGDFKRQEMAKKAKQWFGDFEDYPLKKFKRPKELKQERPKILVRESSFAESLCYIAWRVPGVKHKDIPALDVLSLILGQGESSRLNRTLKNELQLVNGVGASTFSPQDPGFLAVSISLNHSTLDGALDKLNSILIEFLREGPLREEVDKAKINFAAEDSYSKETVDGLARKIGTDQHLFEDHRYSEIFLKHVLDLTASDILKVAKKYLKPDRMNLSLLTPLEKSKAQKSLRRFVKTFTKNLEGLRSVKNKDVAKRGKKINWSPKIPAVQKNKENQFQRIKFPGGGTLVLRPSYETSLVSLRVGLLGGSRLETDQNRGITDLLARTWANETRDLSEEQYASHIDQMASSLSAFGGRNTVGLTATTLAPFSSAMRSIFEETFFSPGFSDHVVAREKEQVYEALRLRKDNPAQLAILQFMSSLFPDHPYGEDLLGTEKTLQAVTGSVLRKQLEQVQKKSNFCMTVTGFIDADEWIDWAKKFYAKLSEGGDGLKAFPLNAFGSSENKFQHSEKEQSHVVVGYRGLKNTDPDKYTLEVIQSLLAGQGGRLFMELRDKASLAYSVSPLRMEGIESGYFGGYIGCSPEKTDKAISMLFEEFEKLINVPVSEEELERAQKYVIGRHDIELQRNSNISASILFDEIYGLGYEELERFPEEIRKVTSKDLQRVAKRIFSQPHVISVVGPQGQTKKKAKSPREPREMSI